MPLSGFGRDFQQPPTIVEQKMVKAPLDELLHLNEELYIRLRVKFDELEKQTNDHIAQLKECVTNVSTDSKNDFTTQLTEVKSNITNFSDESRHNFTTQLTEIKGNIATVADEAKTEIKKLYDIEASRANDASEINKEFDIKIDTILNDQKVLDGKILATSEALDKTIGDNISNTNTQIEKVNEKIGEVDIRINDVNTKIREAATQVTEFRNIIQSNQAQAQKSVEDKLKGLENTLSSTKAELVTEVTQKTFQTREKVKELFKSYKVDNEKKITDINEAILLSRKNNLTSQEAIKKETIAKIASLSKEFDSLRLNQIELHDNLVEQNKTTKDKLQLFRDEFETRSNTIDESLLVISKKQNANAHQLNKEIEQFKNKFTQLLKEVYDEVILNRAETRTELETRTDILQNNITQNFASTNEQLINTHEVLFQQQTNITLLTEQLQKKNPWIPVLVGATVGLAFTLGYFCSILISLNGAG